MAATGNYGQDPKRALATASFQQSARDDLHFGGQKSSRLAPIGRPSTLRPQAPASGAAVLHSPVTRVGATEPASPMRSQTSHQISESFFSTSLFAASGRPIESVGSPGRMLIVFR